MAGETNEPNSMVILGITDADGTNGDPQEHNPRAVPVMTDKVDRSMLPFLTREFEPKTPNSREYQVNLYTSFAKGYNVQFSSNALADLVVVKYVGTGPGTKWNSIYPDRAINPNDRMIEVNGKALHFGMLDELRATEQATIKFRRPVTCNIVLNRPAGRQMGIGVLEFDDNSIWVNEISKEGVIPDWNLQNPLAQVVLGTRILEVNGKKGNCDLLIAELQMTGRIDILLESHGPETANPKEPAAVTYGSLVDASLKPQNRAIENAEN
jgi:hypothetical protein